MEYIYDELTFQSPNKRISRPPPRLLAKRLKISSCTENCQFQLPIFRDMFCPIKDNMFFMITRYLKGYEKQSVKRYCLLSG